MKIKMISMAFTQSGVFDKGQILTDKQYSPEFLTHLVVAANAAEFIDYEKKIVQPEERKVEKPIKKRKGKKKKRV